MSLKTQKQQAAIARRRDIEHQRCERMDAVDRYYDHWGKVTARFGNWVKPEYYQQVENQLKQSKEKQEKQQQVEMRRRKLREFLDKETSLLEQELKLLKKSRGCPDKSSVDTKSLDRVEQKAKDRKDIKRNLDLEEKLYARWQYGVDDEQEGCSKTEQLQKERQEMREQEIREIRAQQECHMDEIRGLQRETHDLKEQEIKIRENLKDLDKELDLLVETSAVVLEPDGLCHAYNLKKIKVLMRKRSELFRNQIKLAISILERVKDYASNKSKLNDLLVQCKEQYEAEGHSLNQIESMYDSEAKSHLNQCEESWQAQHLQRFHDMRELLKKEQITLSARLSANLQRQQDLLELRSTHLSSVESSNERLKQLMEQQKDSQQLQVVGTPRQAGERRATEPSTNFAALPSVKNGLPRLTNSFDHLNLDGAQERYRVDSPRLHSECDFSVVTAENAKPPKFGRKHVVWN